MKKSLIAVSAAAVLLPASLLTASAAHGQATRTWISGGVDGDDVNPCSRTAPCKTFAGAISKTATGGEINAIDSGGFGTLTITKSLTIDGGEGTHASILNSGGIDGIRIRIPAGVTDPQRRVVLRNLSINGTGTTIGTQGIDIEAEGAAWVELHNVRIATQARHALNFRPSVASPDARTHLVLNNVTVFNAGGNAINLAPENGVPAISALIKNSTLSNLSGSFLDPLGIPTGAGVFAGSGADVHLTGTSIFGAKTGLLAGTTGGAPGTITSYCDNAIAGNEAAGDAPLSADVPACKVPFPPADPVIKEVVKEIVKEVPTPAAVQCTVPNLKGLTSPVAGRFLDATNCKLGKVTKKKTKKKKDIGKITAQTVKSGSKLAAGSTVAVTVGKK